MVVITRHKALVAYLKEIGFLHGEYKLLEHAKAEEVRGEHVVGILPMELAALAEKITVVPLAVLPEERGKELPLARIRAVATEPRTYIVREVK